MLNIAIVLLAIIVFAILILLFLLQERYKKSYQIYSNQGIETKLSMEGQWLKVSVQESLKMMKAEQNPKMFASNIYARPHISLLNKEIIHQIYHNNVAKISTNHFLNDILKIMAPNAILFKEGDDWKQARKLMIGGFNNFFLENHINMIYSVAFSIIQNITPNKDHQIPISKIERVCGEVIGTFLFGNTFQDRVLAGKSLSIAPIELYKALKHEQIHDFIPILGPKFINMGLTKKHREIKTLIKGCKNSFMEVFQDCKKDTSLNKTTLMYMLLEIQRLMPQTSLSDEEIVDNFIMMVGMGGAQVSQLLSQVIYYASQEPECYQKLAQECKSLIKMAQRGVLVIDAVNQYDYLHAVIKETMRMQSPNFQPQILDKDIEIMESKDSEKKIKFEEGTLFSIYPSVLGAEKGKTDDDFGKFSPERWAFNIKERTDGGQENSKVKSYDKFSFEFLPFGYMPRGCMGQHLSLLMMKIIVSVLLDKFEFEKSSQYDSIDILTDPSVEIKLQVKGQK